ncbi:MAG: prephenate dehydrogenase/arogenate dehydrogenase family protein [Anaerolineae bacterium]|nr:prephenate dehydrogenase/arogenate dehydrogenase family protein [Anaerolineae bacterium]
MGGSLALALKEQNLCQEVTALVRRQTAAREAARMGVVDRATTNPAKALRDADLIVFSTPVRIIICQLAEFAPYYKPGAVITDMGSTKQEIVQAMAALPHGVHPLGSHPMCGKERSGLSAADPSLFQDAPWILTPLDRTPPQATRLVQNLAAAIGAKTQFLAADRHDRLVAAISHLPYTLAAALVLSVQQLAGDDPAVWDVAASGFRDTSRLAASDVTMMLDILLTNRAAVQQTVAVVQSYLDQFVRALQNEDHETLRALMERAAARRSAMYKLKGPSN